MADRQTTVNAMGADQGDTSSVGSFSTDLSFVITDWDASLASMSGIAGDDAIGRNVFDLIPDLARRGISSRFERVRDLGTTEILSSALHAFLIDCPPRCASSHFDKMQQMVTISSLDSDHERRGIRVRVEDVTERMERERELARRLKDPDENVRMSAAKDISENPDELSLATAEIAIGALGDKNWRVRRKLIEGLSGQLSVEAAGVLLRAVGSEHLDFALLNSAVQILQDSSVDTTRTLIEFLQSDDADLRTQAALILGHQRNRAAVSALITTLRDGDEDENVRAHAIEALGKIGSPEAVEALLSIAEKREFFLAFSALMALKMIGGKGTSGRIIPLLGDEHLREIAVEALGSVGDVEAVIPLVDHLNSGELTDPVTAAIVEIYQQHDESTKAEIRESLCSAIDASGVQHLAESLAIANSAAKLPILVVAGWVDDETLRDELARLIDDENLCDESVRSLVRHGAAAVPHLARKLGDGGPHAKKAAALGLADIGSSDAVRELISALDDPETAPFAAQALANSADPSAAEALRSKLAGSRDPGERASLIRILGRLRSAGLTELILTACDDSESVVRIAAIEQLPGVGEQAAGKLARALHDGSPQVRAAAARVLGTVGGAGSISALRAALDDADPWTRYFAVRSLGTLNDAGSLETIRILSQNDVAEQVRVAAAEVLAGESRE